MKKKKGDSIAACYGKQKLRKVKGSDTLKGECGNDCPWREACISASRERGEDRHYQIENVPFNPFISEMIDNGSSGTPFPRSWMPGMDDTTKAVAWRHTQDLLHRLAHMYLQAPKQFDSCMRSLFAGENQSEQARLAGVTRQAISAGLLLEYAGSTRPDVSVPRPIKDSRERMIYLLYFVDGCSIRSVSQQTKIPSSTVGRLVQKLRSKLAQNGTSLKKKKRKKGGV